MFPHPYPCSYLDAIKWLLYVKSVIRPSNNSLHREKLWPFQKESYWRFLLKSHARYFVKVLQDSPARTFFQFSSRRWKGLFNAMTRVSVSSLTFVPRWTVCSQCLAVLIGHVSNPEQHVTQGKSGSTTLKRGAHHRQVRTRRTRIRSACAAIIHQNYPFPWTNDLGTPLPNPCSNWRFIGNVICLDSPIHGTASSLKGSLYTNCAQGSRDGVWVLCI